MFFFFFLSLITVCSCLEVFGVDTEDGFIYVHAEIIGWYITRIFTESEQVNISLWPRFKMVFDMHLNSLRNANIRTLWEDDVHPHYVMRRYAEFTASLIQLNVDYGDGQVRNKTQLLAPKPLLILMIRLAINFLPETG